MRRLFTHGCDFWAPAECVVYHLWSRTHRKIPTEVRDIVKISQSRRASQQYLKHVLGFPDTDSKNIEATQSYHSSFGLGIERSVSDFEKQIGVNFSTKFIDKVYQSAFYPKDLLLNSDDVHDIIIDILHASESATRTNDSSNTPSNEIAALNLVR